jgi:CrcB protein
VNHFEPMVPRKHWATFGVNITASFALGLIAALAGRCGPGHQISLLLATGFLGSLSTFSTFMVELLQSWLAGFRRQTLWLMVGSVLTGLLAVAAGMVIGG